MDRWLSKGEETVAQLVLRRKDTRSIQARFRLGRRPCWKGRPVGRITRNTTSPMKPLLPGSSSISVSSTLSVTSWRRSPVNEPGAAEGDGGPRASGPVHGQTARLVGHQPVQLILPPQGDFPGGPVRDGAIDQQFLATPFYGSWRMRVCWAGKVTR